MTEFDFIARTEEMVERYESRIRELEAERDEAAREAAACIEKGES